MKRRTFLQQSSFAIFAAAGLPKAIRRLQDSPTYYVTPKNNSLQAQWLYDIAVYNNTLSNFSTASDEAKKLTLKAYFFENSSQTEASKVTEYGFRITGVKKLEDSPVKWEVSTKLDKKDGDHKFIKQIPKNPKFVITPYLSASLLDKKNNPILNFNYHDPSSISEGGNCFLTTACVTHRGLADNCTELNTLRRLREQHMRTNREGEEMLQVYDRLGPALVNAIRSADNKEEILEYMYQKMILPAVELVQHNKPADAISYYKIFTQALSERYL
ncbi:MAG: hypothetical protein J0H92_03075 [Sphingobacteriales bacterium]|nr:hypothetical protein [Sphingobacteriales bacterium]OJW35229.1 MAG: hypothetical protein BGO54_03550 [Sphingobacteriales bacterium 46-32]